MVVINPEERTTFKQELGKVAGELRLSIEDVVRSGNMKWKALQDASKLVEGDIVRYTFGDGKQMISRYNYSTIREGVNYKTGKSKILGSSFWTTHLEGVSPGTGW